MKKIPAIDFATADKPAVAYHMTDVRAAVLNVYAYSRVTPEEAVQKLDTIVAQLRRADTPNGLVLANIVAKQTDGMRGACNSNRIHLVALADWAGNISLGML
jgi:hypothetical protein